MSSHSFAGLSSELRACTQLNLGCGDFPIAGALNVDIRPEAKGDLTLNLNDPAVLDELPADHYGTVYLYHTLEHLDDVFGTLRAVHRLLKLGGVVRIRVPHASRAFTHPEHKHGFDVSFPFYFDSRLPAFYYGTPFELVHLRLDWAIRFDLYRMVAPAGRVAILRSIHMLLTPLANLSPSFFSRIWCYWVGGFEQIEYVFRKPV
jgi:hypothetical protein